MGKYEVTVTFSIKMDMDSEESARDEAEAVVNKVCGYYDPLINPTAALHRHYFWSNYSIPPFQLAKNPDVSRASKEEASEYHGIKLPESTKDQRKLLRNAVNPLLGKHVFDSRPRQDNLFSAVLTQGSET